ncbi:kinesin light chain 1 [Xylaria scruposa]|nr:kinesin light chain 1 [Xylaria scruposa]
MRLLELQGSGSLRLTKNFSGDIPPYAILSHTWAREDEDEVSYNDMLRGIITHKPGYQKLHFCRKQAVLDGIKYFWVDTCCINQSNFTEVTLAINSMFGWYQNSAKCYVYLQDVPSSGQNLRHTSSPPEWESAFRKSRWFTRGWTLQELLAPSSVEFFSSDHQALGDRTSLAQQIHEITRIPISVLRGMPFAHFSIEERISWSYRRETKQEEDIVYSMLGLFQVHMSLIYGEGRSNAFIRLRSKINKRQSLVPRVFNLTHGYISSHKRALWTIPFGRNKNFVGREPILTQLIHTVHPGTDEDDCQNTVIEGLGGIGKTQIALELAYRMRRLDPECSILWVPAINAAGFENGYRDIARELQLVQTENNNGDIMSLVKDALSEEEMGSWLLIIDNADALDMVLGKQGFAKHLPFSRKGSILFTTRNHEITVGLDVPLENIFSVKELDKADASALLQKSLARRQVQNDTSTEELLALLANIPLAIRQASSYMSRTGINTAKYLEHCQSSHQSFVKLLSEDFEDRHRYKATQNPIATTWLISFNLILKEKPLAARYLRFMCLLSERDIPVALLPVVNTELEVYEAIGTLKGYAFIDERIGSDSFDMHRLVRLATQNWVKMEGRVEACVNEVILRLNQVCPSPQHRSSAVWMKYLPHAHAALQFRKETSETRALILLLSRVAEGNEIIGKYDTAEQIHRETLELRHQVLGEDHPDTLTSFERLARTLRKRGKLEDAKEMQDKTLALSRKILGPNHPITLQTLNDVASTLQRQGKYEEAEHLHRETLSMATAVLGEEHPTTLESTRNVAYTLRKQGKYDKAAELQRKALAFTESMFGLEHPESLQNLNNLASTLLEQGHVQEAQHMYRLTMNLLTRLIGEDHPKTLKSKSNLAHALSRLGEYGTAERMQRETLRSMETVLGRQHQDTLKSMSKLGITLWSQEKYLEAEQIHRAVLGLYNTTLGRTHPDTVKGVENLAMALTSQGKFKEANNLYKNREQ